MERETHQKREKLKTQQSKIAEWLGFSACKLWLLESLEIRVYLYILHCIYMRMEIPANGESGLTKGCCFLQRLFCLFCARSLRDAAAVRTQGHDRIVRRPNPMRWGRVSGLPFDTPAPDFLIPILSLAFHFIPALSLVNDVKTLFGRVRFFVLIRILMKRKKAE